jgi:hypothetical protein
LVVLLSIENLKGEGGGRAEGDVENEIGGGGVE